ncbi:MAG: hypothetical protein JXM68_12570 [Sedimentisphaerales bacterium]|nr:hypothetical protein [Sedimentisphaerales bacterium]
MFILTVAQTAWSSAISDMLGSGYSVLTNGSISTGTGVQIEGDLGAGNSIWLADRTLVSGNINTAGGISTGNNVAITGDLNYSSSYWMPGSSSVSGEISKQSWNAPQIGDINISAGNTSLYYASNSNIELASGSYSSLTVSSGSTVYLSSGIYNFSSVWLDRNVNIIADTSAGDVIINSVRSFSTSSNVKLSSIGTGFTSIVSGDSYYLGSNNDIAANLLARNSGSVDSRTVITGAVYASNSLWLANDVSIAPAVAPVVPEPATILILLTAIPYLRKRFSHCNSSVKK